MTKPTICRSALYMPASNPRALAKGPSLDADAIIVDLEDSVAPASKSPAREAAVAALVGQDYGPKLRALRINAPGTPWYADDVDAVRRAAPDVVVLPKVESPEAVRALCDALDTGASGRVTSSDTGEGDGRTRNGVATDARPLGARAPDTRVWAMVETPMAVLRAAEIAALGAVEEDAGGAPRSGPRLDALVVGGNDLALAAGMPADGSRTYLLPWLMTFVAAAKAHGLRVLDGVRNDFADEAALERECVQGRAMGMDGKTLIHPAQIAVANRVWTPDEAALVDARRIVAAFEVPGAEEAGVLQVDGRMVERLHLNMARRTLALAARLDGGGESCR